MFRETNKARKAVIALENLKQDGSVIRYAARFQGLAAKAGWDDTTARDKFYYGLRSNIKDILAVTATRPKTLSTMIAAVQEVADRLDER